MTYVTPGKSKIFNILLQCNPPPEAKLFYYVAVLPPRRRRFFFLMLPLLPPRFSFGGIFQILFRVFFECVSALDAAGSTQLSEIRSKTTLFYIGLPSWPLKYRGVVLVSTLGANLHLYVTVLPPAGGDLLLLCYSVTPRRRDFFVLLCYSVTPRRRRNFFFDVTVLPPWKSKSLITFPVTYVIVSTVVNILVYSPFRFSEDRFRTFRFLGIVYTGAFRIRGCETFFPPWA